MNQRVWFQGWWSHPPCHAGEGEKRHTWDVGVGFSDPAPTPTQVSLASSLPWPGLSVTQLWAGRAERGKKEC